MQQKIRTLLIDALPENLRSRAAFVENTLVLSEELKGRLAVVNAVSRARAAGVSDVITVSASQFDMDYAMYAARSGMGDNEIQNLAIGMIARAYDAGATDIHLINRGTYVQSRFRILGRLCDDQEYDTDTGMRMIRAIFEHLCDAQDAPSFDAISRLDGRIVNRDYLPQGLYSVRVHSEPIEVDGAPDGRGTFMPLRLLRDSTGASGTLEQRLARLGYTSGDVTLVDAGGRERTATAQTGLFRMLSGRTGITFISGPTGSGKSTVLSHCMEALIEERPGDNFLSIEDPPEKPIRGMQQIPVVSKGDDRGRAYTDAIAGTNRDDTDTVMIGEIRYGEAALATIEVALSGNAVWATIHAADALGIVPRLDVLMRGLVAEPLNIACDPLVLSGLVNQRLVPLLCPKCKRPLRECRDAIAPDLLARLRRTMPEELIFGDSGHDGLFLRGEGCELCRMTDASGTALGHPGLHRQTVVAEVVAVDPCLLDLLRRRRHVEARQYWLGECQGMTFLEHARHLVATGAISPDMAEEMLAMPLDADLTRRSPDAARPAPRAEKWSRP